MNLPVLMAAENAEQLPIPERNEKKHSTGTLMDPSPATYAAEASVMNRFLVRSGCGVTHLYGWGNIQQRAQQSRLRRPAVDPLNRRCIQGAFHLYTCLHFQRYPTKSQRLPCTTDEKSLWYVQLNWFPLRRASTVRQTAEPMLNRHTTLRINDCSLNISIERQTYVCPACKSNEGCCNHSYYSVTHRRRRHGWRCIEHQRILFIF